MKTLDTAIVQLKFEIERRMDEYKNTPEYHGCMPKEIRGMIDALNFISGNTWSFGKSGLTYVSKSYFRVGNSYTGKIFLGSNWTFKCTHRTEKTITLNDGYDKFVKRIKTDNKGEYIVFSKAEMGYCEMMIRA